MLRILFTMEDYVRLILMVTAVLNYKFVRTKKAVVLGVLSAIGYIVGVHFFPDYRDIANFLVGDMCIIIGILSVEGKKKSCL